MFADATQDIDRLRPLAPIKRTGIKELSFGESLNQAFDYQMSVESSYARTGNLHDAFEDYIEKIENQTGEKLKNPYRSRIGEFLIEDVALGLVDEVVKNPFNPESSRFAKKNVEEREQKNLDDFYKKLDKLKEKFPELEYKSKDDIDQEIKQRVQELYKSRNGQTVENGFGAFLGDVVGAAIDPINLTASLLTGGANTARLTLGKALAKTAAYEFAANALSEIGVQSMNFGYKKEMGLDPTIKDAAENVAYAGIGGAILGVALKGSGAAVKKLRGKLNKVAAVSPVPEDEATVLALKAELDDYMSETSVFGKDSFGDSLHRDAILKEQERINAAYDMVSANPKGPVDDPLVHIRPSDMDDIVMERGEFFPHNGSSTSGYGIVKFIWKHGEKSPAKYPVMKADILDFPRVVREYEPMFNDRFGDTRHWVVKNDQGYQIVYAARKMEGKDFDEVVTIYVGEDSDKNPWRNKYSEKKVDAAGKRTAHTKDTTQKPYYQHNESSAEASAPESRFQGGGDINENIINQDWEKVNVKELDDYIDKIISERDIDLPDEVYNGKNYKARDYLDELKTQDKFLDEVNSCILEFGK